MGETSLPPGLRRKRIIERPRLMKALDDSNARIKLLIAGPGYGKTTLLEQWARSQATDVIWLRIRQSFNDVAVLAGAIEVGVGSERTDRSRVLERLAVSADPANEVDLLADMLLADMGHVRENPAILVDDYHLLDRSGPSDRFLGTLISESGRRFLIASRSRPSWVSRRAVMYGDVLEVSQNALAMTSDESATLLNEANEERAKGLSALANGWPAVLGLAAVSPDAMDSGPSELPDALYEYFAEELCRGLDPEVVDGLEKLALLPVVDRDIAAAALGRSAEKVCDHGLSTGILETREGRLDLHPLAVAYLEERARRRMGRLTLPSVDVLRLYERRQDWDACLACIRRYQLEESFVPLLGACLDDLLTTSRLATLETWIAVAKDWGLTHPVVTIASAEVELRHGRHLSALTAARGGVDGAPPPSVDPRLFSVAARAAHAGNRENEALEYYELAQRFASNATDRREASWGMLMCLAALERPAAQELLVELEATASESDARDLVRLADKRLSVGFRFGFIRHLPEARQVAELVRTVKDPIVRCSFRSMYAWALVLSAHYDDALREAEALIADASEYRVDYALPYAHSSCAAALAGKSEFEEALRHLDYSVARAAVTSDENGQQNAYSIRVRALVQAGRASSACALEPPDLTRALPSMRGEVLASRALALVSIGRVEEALELARAAQHATSGIEANGVAAVTVAVAALKTREGTLRDQCERLLKDAFESGGVDPVVTGYRGNLDLLAALLGIVSCRDQMAYLLRRAGDEHLAAAVATDASSLVDPVSTLSAREREIYALLCEGLPNRQIAKTLFISEATVKVHVQHVFDKLGIRSRTALALNAARRELRGPDNTLG